MSSNLLTALSQADANPKSGWHQQILFYNSSSDDESIDSTTTSPIKENNTDLDIANTSESIHEDVLLVDESVSMREKPDCFGATRSSTCLSDLHRNPNELRMSSFGRIPKIFSNIASTNLKSNNSIDDKPMETNSPSARSTSRGVIRARGKSRGKILRGNPTGFNFSRSDHPNDTNEDGTALNGRIWKHTDVFNREKLTRPPLHPEVGTMDNNDSIVNNNSLRLPIKHPDTTTKDSGEQTLFIVVTTSPVNNCDARTVSLSSHSVNSSTTQEEIQQTDHKMALCPFCGAHSENFQECDTCHEALPANIKTTLSSNEAQSNKRPAFSGRFDKRTFYDDKFEQYSEFFTNDDEDDDEISFNKDKVFASCSESIRESWIRANEEARSRKHKRDPIIEPPVCLTISSDEEEGSEQISQAMQIDNNLSPPTVDSQPPQFDSPNPIIEEQQMTLQNLEESLTRRDKMRDKDGQIIAGQTYLKLSKEKRPANFVLTDASDKEVELICRSVRIGSYKTPQNQPITFSCQGITIYVKGLESLEYLKLQIPASGIIMVLASFCKRLPCLFIYVTPKIGLLVKERLNMNSKSGPFFDPKSSEEYHKRIVVLPEAITEEECHALRSIFDTIYVKENRSVLLLYEIDVERANSLLVKSKPPDLPATSVLRSNVGATITSTSASPNQALGTSPNPFSKEITKLLVYPPPPQTGGITITSEDFSCLDDGEFLNDVIIDFYLKYLVLHKLSEEDRNRTHLLSSFFYRRLTQKPARQYNSFEDDPSLTNQQKRHTRVKTWTRHVDLFEKDFIIVPINESAHWFLAIICYPGLFEPVYEDPLSVTAESSESQSEEPPQEQENQSIPTEQKEDDEEEYDEDEEDEDEEEEYDDEASSQDNEEVPMTTFTPPEPVPQPEEPAKESVTPPTEPLPSSLMKVDIPSKPVTNCKWQRPGCKKQPCILIFDSLAGPGRATIVKTLREYLSVEWELKKKVARVFSKDTMKGANPRVPQQNNYSDCGVYLLQYAETFFQIPLKDYAIPIRGLQKWFSIDRCTAKRNEIQQLINRLRKEQLGSSQEKPQKSTS